MRGFACWVFCERELTRKCFDVFGQSQMGFDEKKEKLAILIYGEMVGIDCV